MASNLYAVDGKCHNPNFGTYGHECGKPATWLGTAASGFVSGFCDHCKVHGDEAAGKSFVRISGGAPVPYEVTFTGRLVRTFFAQSEAGAREMARAWRDAYRYRDDNCHILSIKPAEGGA